jgi:hypothetical protein
MCDEKKDQERSFDQFCGIWGEGEDGVAYQRRMRGEWDGRVEPLSLSDLPLPEDKSSE